MKISATFNVNEGVDEEAFREALAARYDGTMTPEQEALVLNSVVSVEFPDDE